MSEISQNLNTKWNMLEIKEFIELKHPKKIKPQLRFHVIPYPGPLSWGILYKVLLNCTLTNMYVIKIVLFY